MGKLCLTFDNMGSAQKVGLGKQGGRGPDDLGPLGYPQVLRRLDEFDIQATFFVEGWNALHNPEALQDIQRRGHDVAMHGWVHEPVGTLDEIALARVLSDGCAAFRNAGFEAVGFRAPGGKRGPHLLRELVARNFAYDSSIEHGPDDEANAGRIDAPYRTCEGLPAVPWRWTNIDYYHYAMKSSGDRSPEFVSQYFIEQLDTIAPTDASVTFIFHAFVACETTARLDALSAILRHAKDHPDIEINTAREAAAALDRSMPTAS